MSQLETRGPQHELAERTRMAMLTRDIGFALTRQSALQDTLQNCAQAVVDHLGAAFARIWTLNAEERALELQASAGMYTHRDGPHGRVPVGKFKIGLIAEERKPHLTNAVVGDPRVGDQDWARRETMVAFAGYPLLVGSELVGVLAMFARHPLSEADFEGLGTVANAMAVGIARARADAEIRASEERYRFLADAAPTQVWTAHADLRLEFANSLTHDYFGVDVAALTPDAQQDLIHPDDRGTLQDRWARAMANGEPIEVEYRLRRHDGAFRWHILRARPFRDYTGRVLRWFGTNMDIHEAKLNGLALERRAEELAALTTALQRSNLELDQFAYVASHDLKAPLRGISNLSQWIEEDLGDSASGSVRSNLALLRNRVDRMESLIDGILQYSRIGRSADAAEPVAVGRLIAEVVELIGVRPGVEIIVPPQLPLLVTQRLPLQQVFLNLISNAIKHAGGSQALRITIGCTPGPECIEFTVADNGPGVAPQYHDRVWGIFQTLKPRDQVEGTGIGLALVKKIVEARGGRVWLNSVEGAGATFGFTWPAVPAGEQA